MRSLWIAVIAKLVVLAMYAGCAADGPLVLRTIDDKFSTEAADEWHERHERISTEITQLRDHDWAGRYYYGDGLGVNASITLAPSNGFAFVWHGCMGVYDRNYGTVEVDERGVLQLQLAFENDRCGFHGVADELIPIMWGERHYLIPINQIPDFIDDAHQGREPRMAPHGFWYLREAEHSRPASGKLQLPPGFRRFVLDTQVTARVIGVQDGYQVNAPFHESCATIDAGKTNGIVKGMWFRPVDPDIPFVGFLGAQVIAVDESTSSVVFKEYNCDRSSVRQPQVGWTVKTGGLRQSAPEQEASPR